MPRLTEEDLAARHEGLGATDVVELLGLAPWENAGPMRVWLSKTGEAVDTEVDPGKLAYLEWGHTLEPVLLSWYERQTGTAVLPGGQVRHRDLPFVWATLDAKAPDRIVEAKSVSLGLASHWDESSEDGIPRYVRAQVTVGMACLGIRLADVVATVAGRPPHVWSVGYDEDLADIILRAAADFWKLVQTKTPPKLDATEATKEMLRRKYPTNEDRVLLPADPEADEIAQRRIAATIEERRAWTDKTLADAELLSRIGPHDGIRSQDGEWTMTWRTNKAGKRVQRFTARALKEDA